MFVVTASSFPGSLADVRFSAKQGNGYQYRQNDVPLNTDALGQPIANDPNKGRLTYDVPGTFGYDALDDQGSWAISTE